MGLDQYAFLRERNQLPDDAEELGESFYWRKHARLQQFMEMQWNKLGKTEDLNCKDMSLTEQQLLALHVIGDWDHFELQYSIKIGILSVNTPGRDAPFRGAWFI